MTDRTQVLSDVLARVPGASTAKRPVRDNDAGATHVSLTLSGILEFSGATAWSVGMLKEFR
ncbi:hypothetical protein ACWF95_39925 [Streptomyces vinaceus]